MTGKEKNADKKETIKVEDSSYHHTLSVSPVCCSNFGRLITKREGRRDAYVEGSRSPPVDSQSSARIRPRGRGAKSSMAGRNVECSILWIVEKYECWSAFLLESPEFTFEGLGGSSWSVDLNPSELIYKGCNPLPSVYLRRSEDDAGPESLSLKLEMSIMNADGSTLHSEECEHAFGKGGEREFRARVNVDELFPKRNSEFPPEEALHVLFRMWRGEGSAERVERCTARTRFEIEETCFLHRVPNFSALRVDEERTLRIPSPSKAGRVFTSTLRILETTANDKNRNDEFVGVDIEPSDGNYWLRKMKLSLLDVSGNALKCGELDYNSEDCDQQFRNLQKSFARNFILSRKEECLPNDELSLLCECIFVTGNNWRIEKQLYGIPLKTYNNILFNARKKEDRKTAGDMSSCSGASVGTDVSQDVHHLANSKLNTNACACTSNVPSIPPFETQQQTTADGPHRGSYGSAERLSKCPSALDDLKALCKDRLFSDVVLKTPTTSFPAHKIVLCARSPVFKAMLTADMREGNTDCIRADDLEDETVERLLLFLYSDHLQELEWQPALRLYRAADKYDVARLRVLCSSLLLDRLTPLRAAELLLLADTHGDAELRHAVEEFILEHQEEVFGSEEWDKLSETNPRLVIKTMKLIYKRRKGGK